MARGEVSTGSAATASFDAQVDAVLSASRALVGIAATSIADIEGIVTIGQLRVLMLLATRDEVNLAAVARELDVNPSNASRTVDRLHKAGLLDRYDSPTDRRHLALTLTDAGSALVQGVNGRRRAAVESILHTMTPSARQSLAASLRKFAAAAGEPAEGGAAALLWPPIT